VRSESGENKIESRVEFLRGDGVGAEFTGALQDAVESQMKVSVTAAALLCVKVSVCVVEGGGSGVSVCCVV
jgi:hypothetical protein